MFFHGKNRSRDLKMTTNFAVEFNVDYSEEMLLSVNLVMKYRNTSQFNPEEFMSKPD